MNIFAGRTADEKTWLLPSWGHSLAIGVNPLFVEIAGRIRPVGTAFNIGGVNVTATALHCIEEAMKADPRMYAAYKDGRHANDTLRNAALYVLRSYADAEGRLTGEFVPLEHVSAGPPGDVVFCASQFKEGAGTLRLKMSLQLPQIGNCLHAIGYTNFDFPEDGIPSHQIDQFDWQNEYSHDLRVIESEVDAVFTQRYAKGYLQGAAFSFRGDLRPGMSGGPIFDLKRGVIFGMNAASGLEADEALGSLFHPYVLNPITVGADLGDGGRLRLNFERPIIQLMEFGAMQTDGSHEQLAYQKTENGDVAIAMPYPSAYEPITFESFRGKQEGRNPKRYEGEVWTRTSKERDQSAPEEDPEDSSP